MLMADELLDIDEVYSIHQWLIIIRDFMGAFNLLTTDELSEIYEVHSIQRQLMNDRIIYYTINLHNNN